MLLIVTSNSERTSDEVIKWLIHFNIPFIRISAHDKILIRSFLISNERVDFDIYSNNKFLIKYSQITFYWYRRDHLAFDFDYNLAKKYTYLRTTINRYLSEEIKTFNDFINYLLKLKPSLNSFKDNNLNKLEVLEKANSIGLNIPKTNIICFKDELIEVLNKYKIITKTSCQGAIIQRGKIGLDTCTVEFNKNDLKKVGKVFYPSLVQNKLNKKYELRIFFLNDVLYTSAIFSQNNKKTKLDYRKYDDQIPNRIVPYKLPLIISKKVKILFNALKLKSGSIDMVVTNKNEFVFLEINPIGHFQLLSYLCNYYLEKKIATYLSKQYKLHHEANKQKK